jgi:hypothetical protein
MKLFLFCLVIFSVSICAVAQTYHGESLKDRDVVVSSSSERFTAHFVKVNNYKTNYYGMANIDGDFSEAHSFPVTEEDFSYCNTGNASYHQHCYGMLGVDGDLADAYRYKNTAMNSNEDLSSDPEFPVTPIGEFPAGQSGDMVTMNPGPYGSLVIKFSYVGNKLIKVEPINKTSYKINFTAQSPRMYNGNTYYCFSWAYEGKSNLHYICAVAPK